MTRLLSIPEVADLLSCSVDSVYRLIAVHDLPTVDIGTARRSRTRVRESDLERFIERRTTKRGGSRSVGPSSLRAVP